jgi:hypothetical protein
MRTGVGMRKRLWLLSLAGVGLFAVSAVLSALSAAVWTATEGWWEVPACVGLATAICAALPPLRFGGRAGIWGAVAGGATGIAALFWAFILYVAGTDAYDGASYSALLLVSFGAGIAGLLVVPAAASGRARVMATAEISALALVLTAALIEAIRYEDGDGGFIGLTLIPAVVLGFALWQLRNEPSASAEIRS